MHVIRFPIVVFFFFSSLHYFFSFDAKTSFVPAYWQCALNACKCYFNEEWFLSLSHFMCVCVCVSSLPLAVYMYVCVCDGLKKWITKASRHFLQSKLSSNIFSNAYNQNFFSNSILNQHVTLKKKILVFEALLLPEYELVNNVN